MLVVAQVYRNQSEFIGTNRKNIGERGRSRYLIRGRGSVGRAEGGKELSDDSSPFARKFVGSVKSRYLIRGRGVAGRSRWIGGSVGRCYSIQVM